MNKILFSAALALLVSTQFASADKLPKSAEPLTATELSALYKGNSTNWKNSNAFFADDGRYLIIGKNQKWYGDGKWTVKGNKLCASMSWNTIDKKEGGKANDCWTWYKSGKKYLTHWEGNTGRSDGYNDSEIKKLSKGDKVTKKYKQLAGK
ncbi:MAG: DUF995 domain-containing protein [Rhodobacteraceae bacterium]|nr:DUF995 domain-containing protein [Paracoccaceae bacterium]